MGKGGPAILMMMPRDFSNQVIDWGQSNIPEHKLSGLPNKGYEKGPHISLVTNITDAAPEKALKLLEGQKPFTVKLGDVDCFRKQEKGYDVIKINVVSDILDELNANMLENLSVGDPILPYSPHITLAYVKPFSCEELIGNGAFKDMEIPIEGYVFSDREKGGHFTKFQQGEPLKESLDYGAPVLEFAKKNGLCVESMTSRDFGRVAIALKYSNKYA